MTTDEQGLHELAAAAGVAIDWIDAWGEPQRVDADDLRAVLEALLATPLKSAQAVAAATVSVESDVSFVEPVVVAWDGKLPEVVAAGSVTSASIVLEDGVEVPCSVDGSRIVCDRALPIGYHQLVVDEGRHRSHVFSAPMRATHGPEGASGLIAPMYSLRGEPDTGIGTLRELGELADVCLASGIEVVGTLPLLAAFDDEPSPYAPASRRAWNEVFADLTALPEWDAHLPTPTGDPAWVDHEAAGSAIRDEMARYAAHVARRPRLREAVEAFGDANPEIVRYAGFRAIADHEGRNWRAWPQGATGDMAREFYHLTAQWVMHEQLRTLSTTLRNRGQYLYLDLPIGCHPDGYDIWDAPELFAPASLGAPPDTLFVGGQDWGLPATIPALSRLDGHRVFRKAIRHQLSVAGLLRIDHVMGIHRTWWVPHGRGATQGAFVAQPTEEMFAIICIESVRADAAVVGENLGTVPPEIRTGLRDHDLIGMVVPQDGFGEAAPTDLIAISSHDTPPFLGWWNGVDIDDLVDLGEFDEERATHERSVRADSRAALTERFGTDDPERILDGLLAWMSETPAAVSLATMDDLVHERRRQNVPGTYWERPNWRLRHADTVTTLGEDPGFLASLAAIARDDDD